MNRSLDFSFNPSGIDGLVNRLERLANNVTAQEHATFSDRFDASHYAWFSGGLHSNGQHSWDANGFHLLFDVARSGDGPHGSRARRNAMKQTLNNTLFDVATLQDRALASLTVIVNIPHYQAECRGVDDIQPQNIHANVYLPRNFINLYPEIELPLANAVQSVIEGVGVPFIRHIKDAYNRRGWAYGTDVLQTPGGGPPGIDRPLIPAPIGNSNKYKMWGYPVKARTGPVTNTNTNQEQPRAEIDAPSADDQILALTTRILETEEQLEICQEELRNMQDALAIRNQIIESLRAENCTPKANRSFTSPSRSQSAFTGAGSPSRISRTPLSQNIPSSSAAATVFPSLTHPMMALTSRVARHNLSTGDRSEPPVLGFGMKTAKVLDQLGVGAHVHDVLRDISESHEEADWAYALCLVDGIGVENSVAVAAAMRQDIVSKLNSGKRKGVAGREEK